MKNPMRRRGCYSVWLSMICLSGCMLVEQQKTSFPRIFGSEPPLPQTRLSGVWRVHSRVIRQATAGEKAVMLPAHPDLEIFEAEGSWYTRPDHEDSITIKLASGDWSMDRQTLSIMVGDGDVIRYRIENLTADSLTRIWVSPTGKASASVMEKLVRIQP